ncbi:MAG: hypothetical protein AAGE94_07690, partial [Acidobacteriota bacterium]
YEIETDTTFLGPVFSSSAPSIRRALAEADLPGATHFSSGTVTGRPAGMARALGLADSADGDGRPGSFQSTVHDDCARLRVLGEVLEGLDLDLSEVAILQESTTPYGRSASDLDGTCGLAVNREQTPLVIPFPSSIASLRDRAERHRAQQWRPPTWRRSTVPMEPRSSLPSDVSSHFAPFSDVTPATVDLLLDDIGDVAIHEGIRAVVIVATDVRDTMFLGSELRSRQRGLRLFTLASNVLYARPEHRDALRGMVAVSTYPLLAASRETVGRAFPTFPNEQAEGLYNATILTSGHPRDLTFRVQAPTSLVDTRIPDAPKLKLSELPLWATVVGSGASLPIATYPSIATDPATDGPTREVVLQPPNVSRAALWGGFLLSLVILHLCLRDFGRRFEPWPDSPMAWPRHALKRLLPQRWPSLRQLVERLRAGFRSVSDRRRFEPWPDSRMAWPRHVLRRLRPRRRPSLRQLVERLRAGFRSVSDRPLAIESPPEAERKQELPERRTRFFQNFLHSLSQIYEGFFIASLVALLVPHLAFVFIATPLDQVLRSGGPSLIAAALAAGLCAIAAGAVRMSSLTSSGLLGLVAMSRRSDALKPKTDDSSKPRDAYERFEWWQGEILRQAAVAVVVLFCYFGAVIVYSLVITAGPRDGATRLMLFRAVQIEDGVTPLLPLTLVGAVLVLWTSWHRKRIERLTKDAPFGIAMHEHDAVERSSRPEGAHHQAVDSYSIIGFVARNGLDVRERLFYVFAPGPDLKHLIWLLPTLMWLWASFGLTFEGLVLPDRLDLGLPWALPVKPFGWSAFDIVCRTGILLALITLGSTIYRFAVVTRDLRNLLRRLASTPLLTAFERLPKRISRLARLPLIAQAGSWIVRSTSEQYRQYLKHLGEAVRVDGEPADEQPPSQEAKPLQTLMRSILGLDDVPKARSWPPSSGDADRRHAALAKAVHEAVGRIPNRLIEPTRPKDRRAQNFVARYEIVELLRTLEPVLHEAWEAHPGSTSAEAIATFASDPQNRPHDISSVGSQVQRRFPPGPLGLWLRAAEELVAIEVVGYIESVLKQLQRMLVFLLPTILATGALLGSYPFEPQGLMNTLFIVLVGCSVGAVLYSMVTLNRDEILSRLGRTDPHRFNFHGTFVLNLCVVVGVGLLALISTEYPAVWQMFLGWFRPLLEAIAS